MPPRILVVEDDAGLRRVLELRLSIEGFDVTTAEDGGAGLAALEANRPDAIVTDLMMPRVDGFTFCRRARALPGCEFVPVVVLTAHGRDGDVDRLLELGGIAFMAKPFDAPALASTLRALARAAEHGG